MRYRTAIKVTLHAAKRRLRRRTGSLAPRQSGRFVLNAAYKIREFRLIHSKNVGRAARAFTVLAAAVATAGLLVACGTRGPVAPEPPPPSATASNSVVMPRITYGSTPKGVKILKSDDNCDVPALLRQNVQDQLEEPLLYLLPAATAGAEAAPVLKIEITDLLANAGGIYGGPKIVDIHGTLERPGMAPTQFTARRQMFIYFGVPRSTCSMVGTVTYTLGSDIIKWMKKPVDGAFLGVR
jgi:hypothetical protein